MPTERPRLSAILKLGKSGREWSESAHPRHHVARASSVPSRASMSTTPSASAFSCDAGLSGVLVGEFGTSSDGMGSRVGDEHAGYSDCSGTARYPREHTTRVPDCTGLGAVDEWVPNNAASKRPTAPPSVSFARGDCTNEFVELLTASPSPALRRINAFRRVVLEPQPRSSPVKGVPSLAAVATAARVAAGSVAAREDATAVVDDANWIISPLAPSSRQQVAERWQRALGAVAAVGGAAVAATVNAARRDGGLPCAANDDWCAVADDIRRSGLRRNASPTLVDRPRAMHAREHAHAAHTFTS